MHRNDLFTFQKICTNNLMKSTLGVHTSPHFPTVSPMTSPGELSHLKVYERNFLSKFPVNVASLLDFLCMTGSAMFCFKFKFFGSLEHSSFASKGYNNCRAYRNLDNFLFLSATTISAPLISPFVPFSNLSTRASLQFPR